MPRLPSSSQGWASKACAFSAIVLAVRLVSRRCAGPGSSCFGLCGLGSGPLYQCRHTYATLLLSEGLNPLYVAHQMGHSTVAMIVRHYARWTRKPDRSEAERVERSLAAAGNIPPKMPEICQKAVDSNP